GWGHGPPLPRAPGRRLRPRPRGDALSDAVQSGGERAPVPDRGGPADEDQEGRLEGVLGGMDVAEQAAADAEDEGAVPLHQQGERGLVAADQETLQEFGVGQVAGRRVRAGGPQEAEHVPERCLGHGVGPPWATFYPHSARARPIVPKNFERSGHRTSTCPTEEEALRSGSPRPRGGSASALRSDTPKAIRLS